MNDYILGIDNRNVDYKYRIRLPKFIGVKVGDKLVLIYRKDFLEVKEFQNYVKELNNYREFINKAENKETYEFYQEKMNEITSCISSFIEVKDEFGRINLKRETVERYKFNEGTTIEGTVDGIRIWNIHKFEEYQNKHLKSGRK